MKLLGSIAAANAFPKNKMAQLIVQSKLGGNIAKYPECLLST